MRQAFPHLPVIWSTSITEYLLSTNAVRQTNKKSQMQVLHLNNMTNCNNCNQSINQSINQSTNQSINQSINQSTNQSISIYKVPYFRVIRLRSDELVDMFSVYKLQQLGHWLSDWANQPTDGPSNVYQWTWLCMVKLDLWPHNLGHNSAQQYVQDSLIQHHVIKTAMLYKDDDDDKVFPKNEHNTWIQYCTQRLRNAADMDSEIPLSSCLHFTSIHLNNDYMAVKCAVSCNEQVAWKEMVCEFVLIGNQLDWII